VRLSRQRHCRGTARN